MFYSDDPAKDYERYSQKQQDWLDSLPKCEQCGDPIQGEKLCDFDGTLICFQCLKDYYIKNTEDYIEK